MLGKTREAVFVGSVVVPQVDKLLRRESLPAEGTLRLGVTPLRDALPAEQVATGCGRGVPALLQAQGAQGAPGNGSVFHVVPAVGQAAVRLPFPLGTLPLPKAVELQAHRQRQVQ